MKMLITLFFAGAITSNLITTNLLGIESLQRDKRNLLSVLKSGLIITVLLLVSTAATYPLGFWVLVPLKLEYLSAFIYMLIIFGMLFGCYILTGKFLPKFRAFLNDNCDIEAFMPLALAACLMNSGSEIVTNYLTALLYSLICGIGYTLVSVILFALNDRLKTVELPKSVKGLPITLIILSLISLAFGGLKGI